MLRQLEADDTVLPQTTQKKRRLKPGQPLNPLEQLLWMKYKGEVEITPRKKTF